MANEYLILGIDPGNTQSAFCLCTQDLKPLAFEKTSNEVFIKLFNEAIGKHLKDGMTLKVAIEDIENFGMPAGRSLFDTAKYIGKLAYWFELEGIPVQFIYRHEEKMTICRNPRANDATIRQALVDRFAPGQPNYGKGTKKAPGFFHGFSADVWSSFAIATTYHDKYLGENNDSIY